jgi:hypothetical protein
MTKGTKSSSISIKVSFGKKSVGKHQKRNNKHNNKERNYRGQGR